MRFRHFAFLVSTAVLVAGSIVSTAAQSSPQDSSRAIAQIIAVGPIQMTVGDMDRSVDFYSRVLTFEKISDSEVAGENVERLFGVFGARVHIFFFFQAEDGIRDGHVTGVQTCALPILARSRSLVACWYIIAARTLGWPS